MVDKLLKLFIVLAKIVNFTITYLYYAMLKVGVFAKIKTFQVDQTVNSTKISYI